jgi:hypothetical protein
MAIMLSSKKTDDMGYDSDEVCADLQERGATLLILSKSNRRVQPEIDRNRPTMRKRIEHFSNNLKNSRRVANRHGKLGSSFLGFVHLTKIRLSIKFIHTT